MIGIKKYAAVLSVVVLWGLASSVRAMDNGFDDFGGGGEEVEASAGERAGVRSRERSGAGVRGEELSEARWAGEMAAMAAMQESFGDLTLAEQLEGHEAAFAALCAGVSAGDVEVVQEALEAGAIQTGRMQRE